MPLATGASTLHDCTAVRRTNASECMLQRTCTRSSKSAPPKALLQKRAREVTCLKAPAHTTPQCIARIPQIRAELGGRVRGGRGRGVGAHVHTLLQKRSSKSAPPKACARSDLPQGTCAHNPTMHCTHPSDQGRARGQGAGGTGAGGGGARAHAPPKALLQKRSSKSVRAK